MSPVGARGDHFGLMIKHVDAQDNDTGHSVLLLKEGGQGEKSQLELLVVEHLDRDRREDCCCNKLGERNKSDQENSNWSCTVL